MTSGSRAKLNLWRKGTRPAWLASTGLCGLVLGLSLALLAGLWAGIAKADPRPPLKIDNSFFAGYRVPAARPNSAADLAAAIDIAAQDLISAEVTSGNLEIAFAIFGRIPGSWFPTRSHAFLWMTTGDAFATNFLTPTTLLNAAANTTRAAELGLALHVPSGMTCANFDFAFYTVEPRHTAFATPNDFFVAQINTHALLTPTAGSGLPISAPTNFALGRHREMVTVQSVYAAPSVSDPPPTDGAVSPLLQARVAVTPNQTVEIYLSLRAAGSSLAPSAVAIDNFHWSKDSVCSSGQSGDRDGDGLPDGWELYGVSLTVPSPTGSFVDYVNLPLIGADPDHKDVLVEIDSMMLKRPTDTQTLFDYTPNPAAITAVVNAFNSAPITNPDGVSGIHLHVDYGANVRLQWPGDASQPWTWDSWDGRQSFLGNGSAIPFDQYVLFCPDEGTQDWSHVDQIKRANLKKAHALVFHYGIWGHQLCEYEEGVSGISRNYPNEPGEPDYFAWGASDFIVTLGDAGFQKGVSETTLMHQEAGTFMHELGHNLGLQHGGSDSVNYKPNHLSVMNGLFQLDGLMVDGKRGNFDYTGFVAPPLTTTHLLESRGVYELNQQSATHFGTRHYCPSLSTTVTVTNAWQAIDWNCNRELETEHTVTATIIKPCAGANCGGELLTSTNEWHNLAYTGGLLRRDLNLLSPQAVFPVIAFMLLLPEPDTVITNTVTPDTVTPDTIPQPDRLEDRIPVATNFHEITAADR